MSEFSTLKGEITWFKCAKLEEIILKISTLNSEGEIVKTQNIIYPKKKEFFQSISSQRGTYLLLEVNKKQGNQKAKDCFFRIHNLTVTNSQK